MGLLCSAQQKNAPQRFRANGSGQGRATLRLRGIDASLLALLACCHGIIHSIAVKRNARSLW